MGVRLRWKTPEVRRGDRRYLGRSSPPDDLVVVATEGAHVIDAQGRRYIDFLSGWCVGNLGWGNREIADALRRFDGPDYVMPSALYPPWVELASRLASVAPGKLQRCFRATTGTESVEQAILIARAVTGRKKVARIKGDYHGNSLALRERHPTLAPPLDERALARLEKLLAREDVAALLMEPIITNLDVLIPEPAFMRGARELCRRYGTLLVLDEVATGFGRTGAMFAAEHYDLEPDILCIAKGLTSGYAPMAATITTEEIARELDGDADFYATWGWHPLGVAAGLATLRYFERHGAALWKNVAARSADFARRLAGHAVRIKGLAIAVELEGRAAGDLAGRCRDAGLLLDAEDGTVTLFPPLTIDRDTVDAGLDILEECLAG